jgi:isopentenyl phosphate kinase
MRLLVFLKLGGSLITDKQREASLRPDILTQVAQEVRRVLRREPGLNLVLGHGSGSFGHFAARRTELMAAGPRNWPGFAETSAAAARLNRLVTDIFLSEGVPVVSLQPSASAACENGELYTLAVEPLRAVLAGGCVPVVYGDVAIDARRGYTIISTEQIFAYLAGILKPDRIVLAGQVPGVLTADPNRDPDARLIPLITPVTLPAVEHRLSGSAGVDVTGGMLTKVREMLNLVERQPRLEVRLVSGLEPGMIERALLDDDFTAGTVLRAENGG